MWVETSGGHESVLASVACIALVSWTTALIPRLEISRWQTVVCGVGWGIAFLITPMFIPMLLRIVLLLYLGNRRPSVLYRLASVLFVAVLTVSPWLLRNYLVFKMIVPIRDNLGLELSVSNNDHARPVMEWNLPAPTFRHPYSSLTETLKMQAIGEKEYYRLKMLEAVEWIRTHPGRFLWFTGQRMLFFWFSPAANAAKKGFLLCLTIGGFSGLYLLYKRDRQTAFILGSIWVTCQIPYYFVQVSSRYRFPIDWSFWLLSAYAVLWLSNRAAAAGSMRVHRST